MRWNKHKNFRFRVIELQEIDGHPVFISARHEGPFGLMVSIQPGVVGIEVELNVTATHDITDIYRNEWTLNIG